MEEMVGSFVIENGEQVPNMNDEAMKDRQKAAAPAPATDTEVGN